MSGITRHYTDNAYGQAHYYRAAPAAETGRRPVLCFHMSPWSGKSLEPLIAELGRDRLCIAIDTPGYGNSDPPSQPPGMADYAASAAAVADALGLDEFDVFGDRTGAKLALALAVAQAQGPRVRHVITGGLVIWTAEQIGRRREYPPEPISPDGSHLSALWRLSLGMSMDGRSLERFAEVFYTRMMNMHLQHWGRRAAAEFDAGSALDGLTGTPVLMLNPQDDLWNVAYRAQPSLHHPESRIHDLPDWGYGYTEIKAAELADLMRGFLDKPS